MKPVIATIMMAICSYAVYLLLADIIAERMATLIALFMAVIIYALALAVLRILTKEDIYMLPHGQKVYKILCKLGLYKESEKRQ